MATTDNVHTFLTRKAAAQRAAAQEIDCARGRASALIAATAIEVALAHHRPGVVGGCQGCGLDIYEEAISPHIDDCPVLSGNCRDLPGMERRVMACKCGAETLNEHQDKIREGAATGHVFTGFHWMPASDPWYDHPTEGS